MADNYLEKKMEEHRNGARPVFRAQKKKTRAVFITDGLSPQGRATLRSFAAEGDCRIAFAVVSMRALLLSGKNARIILNNRIKALTLHR